jgi:hypothetical protein
VVAVEAVLSAAAGAAGHVSAAAAAGEEAAAPSAVQVEEARDRCLRQLAAVRAATQALPASLPAPPVGDQEDPALEALRAERDQLREEAARKNRDVKATLDAMRSLQADIVTMQTQRQQLLGGGGARSGGGGGGGGGGSGRGL